jgi:cysteine desulfurase / selenocysteine lyase
MDINLNSQQRFEEFPITRTKVFLAHAAICPFPQRVCHAISDYCQKNANFGQWEYLWSHTENETRTYAAKLVGGSSDEIAFISSTSMGLSLIAGGLSWHQGDNVVVANGDFPANIYPWLNLNRLGVKTKLIPRRANGSVTVADITQTIDKNTRLVSLSSVNFVTGFRLDLDTIGSFLQKRGILFCVDAIQSLGALPFSSEYVDFAVASSHKWLMGPIGIGILFVKKKHFTTLNPVLIGWKSVNDNHNYLNYHPDLSDTAKRYEPGTLNGIGIVGLHAALAMLLEIGIDNIAAHLGTLRNQLITGLKSLEFEVLSPSDNNSSGIISFTSNSVDISKLRKFLDLNNFIVSIRDTLDGRNCIRVSPHFYNTGAEIESLINSIDSYINTNRNLDYSKSIKNTY